MLKLNDANFKNEVLDSDKPVIVDFWAEWCMPCKMLGPIFEELSNEMKEVKFGKVNVDESQDLAQTFFVQGIPTMIIFNNGEEISRIVGMRDKDSLRKEIESFI